MNELSVYVVMMLLGWIVTQGLVEYALGLPFDHFAKLTPFKKFLRYPALAIGIVLAWYYNIDIVALIWGDPTHVGNVLTGVLIGMGSSAVHQIFELMTTWIQFKIADLRASK